MVFVLLINIGETIDIDNTGFTSEYNIFLKKNCPDSGSGINELKLDFTHKCETHRIYSTFCGKTYSLPQKFNFIEERFSSKGIALRLWWWGKVEQPQTVNTR